MDFYFQLSPEETNTEIEFTSYAQIYFQLESQIPFPRTPYCYVDMINHVRIKFDPLFKKSKITNQGEILVFKISRFGEIRSKHSPENSRPEELFYERRDLLKPLFERAVEHWIQHDRETEIEQLKGLHKLKKASKRKKMRALPLPNLVFRHSGPDVMRTTISKQAHLFFSAQKLVKPNCRSGVYGHSDHILTVVFSPSMKDSACGLEEREGEHFTDGQAKFIYRFNKLRYISHQVPRLCKLFSEQLIQDAFYDLARNLSLQNEFFSSERSSQAIPESAQTWHLGGDIN